MVKSGIVKEALTAKGLTCSPLFSCEEGGGAICTIWDKFFGYLRMYGNIY